MASSKKRQCADLPQHLADFLQRHIPPGSSLLLGLSGGLDSRVLLDLLAKAASSHSFHLSALHVHHGISPNADAWADFCHEVCAAVHIPLKVVKVNVPRDSGLGLEAAARNTRYAALLAERADFVMLAHHRDDQAETLMLQLLRGAGVKGLAGMGKVNNKGGNIIVRPLLEVARADLFDYAQAHQLAWIDDESNLDLAYDRNFLRHEIIPTLEKRFPASVTTLSRSAAHLAEAAGLLEELAASDAISMLEQNKLALPGLRQLTEPRAKNLLRYWFGLFNIDAPSSVKLEEMLRQLQVVTADTQSQFRLGAYDLRCYRSHAWLVPHRVKSSGTLCLDWNGEERMSLHGLGVITLERAVGEGISLQSLAGNTLTFRLRQGGERFKPDGSRPIRSLKSLLQNCGIPPWQRETLPLLFCNDELVAVPGIGVACRWQAGPGIASVKLLWRPD